MFRNYRDTVRTPKNTEITYPELNKDAYNCDMCDKGGWLTPNDVEIHKKNAHVHLFHHYKVKHKERFCTVCMSLLESREELIKHLKSEHLLSSPTAQRVERVIYICDKCTNIFFNKDVLTAHMLSVHLTNRTNRMNKHFTCPKCFKTFRLNTIWFHLQKHEIPSVSLCDICITNFPNRSMLSEHVKSHKRYLKCESCGYSSNKFLQYESHIDQHDNRRVPSDRGVSQQVLSSVFKKPKNRFVQYNMHNAIKGLNLPKFMQICTLCREICVSYEEMKKHVIRDHMIDETEKKKHLCVCGEEFEYKVVLKQHLLKMKGSHRAVEKTEPSVSTEGKDISKMTETPNVSEIADINMDTGTPNPVSGRSCLQDPDSQQDLCVELKDASKAELTIKIPETTKQDNLDESKMDMNEKQEESTVAEKTREVPFAAPSPKHHENTELKK